MKKNPGLALLCISAFLLFGLPKLYFRAGPVPVYILDFFLLATFLVGLKYRATNSKQGSIGTIVGAILFFAVLSELVSLIVYAQPMQTVYVTGRTLIAFSVFYSIQHILKTPDDYHQLFKAITLGMLLTSTMMIISSLPPTRGLANFMFSIPFVEPASEGILWRLQISEDALRGRSFIGVSNLSGAFICAAWPLMALLYRWPGISPAWKKLTLLCLMLAPFGIIMSYSRGAILGLLFAVGGAVVFGSSRSRRGIVLSMLVALMVLNVAGLDSKLFFFERLEDRFEEMMEDPYQDERETERIYSYVHPFVHVTEKPLFLILGEGNAVRRIPAARGGERRNWAYHSFFGVSYFAYGMVAAFLYALLIVSAFLFARRSSIRMSRFNSVNLHLARSVQISLFALVPWLLTAHGMVTSPRGTAMFLLVLGVISSLRRMELFVSPRVSLRQWIEEQSRKGEVRAVKT